MMRDNIARHIDHDPNFRWRGKTATRIENLSDIAFALALSLIVSATEIPRVWNDLKDHVITIIPVALCFIVLIAIWQAHFTFFRRYGIADRVVVYLNAFLLLMVMFLAYPLRFMFESLFAYILGISTGDWTPMSDIGLTTLHDAAMLMAYFAAGYAVIFGLLMAMYIHAFRKADLLGLSDTERTITLISIWRFAVDMILALIATFAALYTILGPFAGFILNLGIPAGWVIKSILKMPETFEAEPVPE